VSVETPEFAAMVKRMVRAHGRRVAAGDPVDLAPLVELRGVLEEAIGHAVAGLVEEGFSWREVGEGLGVSREAAWKRYQSHVAARAVPGGDAETA
jgi:hypothetical protein